MSKANIVTATGGKDMASFREIHSLSPRGRYDIKFYPTFFHLHGKTFDYKITVSNVIRNGNFKILLRKLGPITILSPNNVPYFDVFNLF